MKFIVIFFISIFALNTPIIAAQSVASKKINILAGNMAKKESLSVIPENNNVKDRAKTQNFNVKERTQAQSNNAQAVLIDNTINSSDAALIKLYNKVLKNTLKKFSPSDWAALKPSDICSESVCRADDEVKCLRRFTGGLNAKCQTFQRKKIERKVSDVINECPKSNPIATGPDFSKSTPLGSGSGSGVVRKDNNVQVSSNMPVSKASQTQNKIVSKTRINPLMEGVKNTSPYSGGALPAVNDQLNDKSMLPAVAIGIGGAVATAAFVLNDNDDGDSLLTSSPSVQNQQLSTNMGANLTPMHDDLYSNFQEAVATPLSGSSSMSAAFVNPSVQVDASKGASVNEQLNAPYLSAKTNKVVNSGRGEVDFHKNEADMGQKDTSCSAEAMIGQGRKYAELYKNFIEQEDNMNDSVDPDKSTTSLYKTSLEMLNLAFLTKRPSFKKGSIYLAIEYIKAYALDIKTYFSPAMIQLLSDVCNCMLNEDKEGVLNENLKAFLEGTGYFSQ